MKKKIEIELINHTSWTREVRGLDWKDGKDGATPTEEQLLALIEPRIPKITQPKDWKSPTKAEIKEIIKEVLPEDKLIEKIIKKVPQWKDWQKGDKGDVFRFADLTPYEKQVLTWPQGSNGVGVPRWGTANQKLIKSSSRDFDTAWADDTGGGSVETVTGLNTDNTDPANPIVKISVDGVTVTGLGTPASPLVAVWDGTGDVHWPASAVNNNFAAFDLTTGKIIKDSWSSASTFATAAQGALADTALQPSDIASGTITARADDINFSGGIDGDVLTVQADGSLALEAAAGGGANTALSNLASVAINTSLVSDTDNTDDLGTTLKKWANLFVTTIGATATRVTKGWFTDLEVTNAITGSITGNAATVTTNANLTGDVTSTGNATTIANSAVTLAKMADLAQDQFIGRTTASTGVPQTATITAAARTVLDDTTVAAMVDTLGGATSTGTGGIARATSPTFVTPALGTPSALVATNATGTATGLTSWITNALKSATTTVDVSAATAPTSGQVLTATSGTTATWQTPTWGAWWVTIWTGTLASANATLMDVTSISSTYDTFRITICWLNVSGSSRDIWLRFNNDTGSNYATESTFFSSGTVTASRESSQTKIRLNVAQAVMTSSTNHYTITVSKPTTGMPASINFDGKINNTSSVVKIFGSADWNNTSAKIDRIKIQDEDGTGIFDTGSFYILEWYVVT